MSNATQPGYPGGRGGAVSDAVAARNIRASRGLRTLEHDIAEFKKTSKPPAAGGVNGDAVKTPAPSRAPVAPKALQPTRPIAATQTRTNYAAELERLANKYIPEKKPAPQTENGTAPSPDALKSFEMNKAFNDQLHKERVPEQVRTAPQVVPAPTRTVVPPPPPAPQASSKEMQEPQKKPDNLTEKGITEELDRVLKTNQEKHAEHAEARAAKSEPKKEPERRRPQSSIKELESALSDLETRVQSSASRIETYRDEAKQTTESLKNLFERRDIINKNLDPIREKERAVLASVKELEEKETTATNKIEKREAENKRWEKETERRELEDERWRLEEIFEKLRVVLEKTEHEQVAIRKKLEEEEKHKGDLEAEKRLTQTHRDLLAKREEQTRVEKERDEIQERIMDLKSGLKSVRTEEENLEKKKREIEGKVGALNDANSKRTLEEERRRIEDELHTVEEKRWAREDELKKYYGEKDEKDRAISVLSTEVSSLQNKFDELERDKKSPSEEAISQ